VRFLTPGLLRKLGDHVGLRTDVRFLNLEGRLPEFEEQDPEGRCIFLHEPYIPEACGRFCVRSPGLCNVSCQEDRRGYCTHGVCKLQELRCKGSAMEEERDWGKDFVFMDNFYSAVVDQVVPHPTAGFKAIIYAMSRCESVSLFGFGPSCGGEGGARYYPSSAVVFPWHHYDEELMLLKRASALGALGTKVLVPPEARRWIGRATEVKAMFPPCLGE